MYDRLQFHDGAGYIRETAIERMTRDARIQSTGGGAVEAMLDEVAKRMVCAGGANTGCGQSGSGLCGGNAMSTFAN